jgi:prefoldin subunit 5
VQKLQLTSKIPPSAIQPDPTISEMSTKQVSSIQGPSVQEPIVLEQPKTLPQVSMTEVRSLRATGNKLKEEITSLNAEVLTARQLPNGLPTSPDTLDTMQAEMDRLFAKQQELTPSYQEYRSSVKEIMRRVEEAEAKVTDEAKRISRRKGHTIKGLIRVLQETSVVYKEMLFTLRHLCDETIAMHEAVERMQEERRRQVVRLATRILNGAGL